MGYRKNSTFPLKQNVYKYLMGEKWIEVSQGMIRGRVISKTLIYNLILNRISNTKTKMKKYKHI